MEERINETISLLEKAKQNILALQKEIDDTEATKDGFMPLYDAFLSINAGCSRIKLLANKKNKLI